ncbi:8-oxo-dGTP diphosphatase [Candidatus Falkowbacteria bacterium]|nr:8-oxo-dGTP diphosphatase [Candidatus Falkowbacteria bacterium]
MKKLMTLCVIQQEEQLLLGMKKRGFGAGRWNGFGGKVGIDETIEAAAQRELLEEAGVVASSLDKVGIIEFEFQHNSEILEVHIFKAVDFSGQPTESEEMRPQWFSVEQIPYKEMWPDDIYWLPLFLAEKKFVGKFLFGDGDMVLKKELIEVNELV